MRTKENDQRAPIIPCITSFSVTPSSLISLFSLKKNEKSYVYPFYYEIIDGEGGLNCADVNNWLDVNPLELIQSDLEQEEVILSIRTKRVGTNDRKQGNS